MNRNSVRSSHLNSSVLNNNGIVPYKQMTPSSQRNSSVFQRERRRRQCVQSELFLLQKEKKYKESESIVDQANHILTRQNKILKVKKCINKLREKSQVNDFITTNQQQQQYKYIEDILPQSRELIDDQATNKQYEYKIDKNQIKAQQYANTSTNIRKPRQMFRKNSIDKFRKLIWYLNDNKIKRRTSKKLIPFSIRLMPNNIVVLIWNVITMLMIVQNLFALPVHDIFDNFAQIECGYVSILLFIEGFLMVLDILIQFNIVVLIQGNMISESKLIAKHYIKHGLITDVLALIGFIVWRYNSIFSDCIESNTSFQNFFVRICKYLFLFKMKRLIKLKSYMQQVLSNSKKTKNQFVLIELLFLVIFMSHFIACFWIFVANQSTRLYPAQNWIEGRETFNSENLVIYLQSMYFACMTMTTVGYGDILPKNPLEYFACILIMLFSCGFFAYSLNTITQTFLDIQNEKRVYKRELEIIQNFMRKKKIDGPLKSRVENYLKSMHSAGLGDDAGEEQTVINKLSTQLQQQLQLEDKGKILQQIPFFSETFSQDLLLSLTNVTKEIRLSPEEVLDKDYWRFDDAFIYVVRGEIDFLFKKSSHKSQFLFSKKQGEYFGLPNLFKNIDQPSSLKIQSCDFTILYILYKSDFQEIAQQIKEPLQKEKYCYLKDRILFQEKYNLLNIPCFLCGENNHLFQNCRKFFFKPDNQRVIKQFEFSKDMNRQEYERSQKSRQRTLKQFHKNFKAALPLIQDISDLEESIESNSNCSQSSYKRFLKQVQQYQKLDEPSIERIYQADKKEKTIFKEINSSEEIEESDYESWRVKETPRSNRIIQTRDTKKLSMNDKMINKTKAQSQQHQFLVKPIRNEKMHKSLANRPSQQIFQFNNSGQNLPSKKKMKQSFAKEFAEEISQLNSKTHNDNEGQQSPQEKELNKLLKMIKTQLNIKEDNLGAHQNFDERQLQIDKAKEYKIYYITDNLSRILRNMHEKQKQKPTLVVNFKSYKTKKSTKNIQKRKYLKIAE